MDKTNGLPVQNGIDTDVKDFRYVHHTLIINQHHAMRAIEKTSGSLKQNRNHVHREALVRRWLITDNLYRAP